MTTPNLEVTFARPMPEQTARNLGLTPGTCRLLIETREKPQNPSRLFAELLVRGFGTNIPISIRAEGPFRPLRNVIKLLDPAVQFDGEAVTVKDAKQLAIVLEQWSAEELVILPCDLHRLSVGLTPDGSMFKLAPSGHMHRFIRLLDECGPIANYSADHKSLECFGSEAQIMPLFNAATAAAAQGE